MPLMRCSENGKSGWKWGDSGKCYTSEDGKELATKQGQAIEANKHANAQAKPGILTSFLNALRKFTG